MLVVETMLQKKSQISCLTDTRNMMKKVFKYMLSNYVKSLFICISQSRNYISDKVLGLSKNKTYCVFIQTEYSEQIHV